MRTQISTKSIAVALMVGGLALALSLESNAYAGGPGGGGGGVVVGGGGGGGAGGGGGGGGGGSGAAVSGLSSIVKVLQGPWESLIGNEVVTVTFNNNGTFSAAIESSAGPILTDAGTWTITATSPPEPFSNAQGHLQLVDGQGIFLTGDVLLLKPDQLVMISGTGEITGLSPIPDVVLTKVTP
jgi:hypothetical protein